jgi:hypothetical protein
MARKKSAGRELSNTECIRTHEGEIRFLRTGRGRTVLLLHTLRTQIEYFIPLMDALERARTRLRWRFPSPSCTETMTGPNRKIEWQMAACCPPRASSRSKIAVISRASISQRRSVA